MHISLESPAETEWRLRRVAAAAVVEVLPGEWWYDEFPLAHAPGRLRADAIAMVRDRESWCQLVPARVGDRPGERLRIWSIHFPEAVDNSGFIGWLATRIKASTGSGILVVCGQNGARGGIYDYGGCPAEAASAVLAELRALTSGAEPRGHRDAATSFHGRRMRAVATAVVGEVDSDTLFTFAQEGTTVWARYSGGAVDLGYLVGTMASGRLAFRYAQVDRKGEVHGGHSICDVSVLPDGRLRLQEHFQWESRPGAGTNVIEEIAE